MSVTAEKAILGKVSICVTPQVEFKDDNRQLSQMTGGKPKKMTVTAWAWVPKDAKALIVVDIKHSPEKAARCSTKAWSGLDGEEI